MKTIVFASLLFFPLGLLNAQLTLTQANNEPKAGDKHNFRYFDSTQTLVHVTGQNQVFDYSSLRHRFLAPFGWYNYSTPPSNMSFTNGPCNLRTGDSWEYSRFFYSSASPQQLEYLGSSYGSPTSIAYTNKLILYKWPISYGDVFSDDFAGTWAQSQTWNGVCGGSYTLSGSGTGTLILPEGIKLTNVLQVSTKKLDTLTNWTTNGNTEIIHETSYQYYHSSSRFPALELTYYKIRRNGVWYTPSLEATIINSYAVSVDEKTPASNTTLYPNPAIGSITAPKNGILQIYDFEGKLLIENTCVIGEQINIERLEKGIYLVKFKGDINRFEKLIIE